MKRFIVTTLLVLTVIGAMCLFIPQPFERELRRFVPSDAYVCVYCRATELPSVNLGYGYITRCGIDELTQTLSKCSAIDGFSATFNGSVEDFEALLRKLRFSVCNEESIGGVLVATGRSGRIRGGITVDGVKVNIQLAYADGIITIGYPLILGEY
ncbi:MAG: hypothetical protein NC099_01305 [Corallococcus sp.]|nr:hypothetical protein [Corallococcus sp.]